MTINKLDRRRWRRLDTHSSLIGGFSAAVLLLMAPDLNWFSRSTLLLCFGVSVYIGGWVGRALDE